MTKALTTAAALTLSLRVTVNSMVRSTMRLSLQSFGVPLRTLQMTHGPASCSTVSVTTGPTPTVTNSTAFQCVF